jgi:hypothetical protein
MFDGCPAQVEGALEVHVDHEIVVSLRYGQKRLGLHDGGAIDETVDAAEAGNRAFEHGPAVVEGADIAANAVQIRRPETFLSMDVRISALDDVAVRVGDEHLVPSRDGPLAVVGIANTQFVAATHEALMSSVRKQ